MKDEEKLEVPSARIFGTSTRTSTLLLICMLGETHASEIARILGRSPSRIKEAADSLEKEGMIIGASEGTAKRFRLNPRFVAAAELEALLTKLGVADMALQDRLALIKRRPGKAGKEI